MDKIVLLKLKYGFQYMITPFLFIGLLLGIGKLASKYQILEHLILGSIALFAIVTIAYIVGSQVYEEKHED